MGQSKNAGYTKLNAVTAPEKTYLDQSLEKSGVNLDQAVQAFLQFLPGGAGGEALATQAQNRFNQQTVPDILNKYGSESKGSTSLNHALAAGAANLNTDIAALLAQLGFNAAQGIGNIGLAQGQQGLSKDRFAYAPRQPTFGENAAIAGINALGQWGSSGFKTGGA